MDKSAFLIPALFLNLCVGVAGGLITLCHVLTGTAADGRHRVSDGNNGGLSKAKTRQLERNQSRLASDWPDMVFDDNYSPLSADNYSRTGRPMIPSAKRASHGPGLAVEMIASEGATSLTSSNTRKMNP
jgi:hypothetical protein